MAIAVAHPPSVTAPLAAPSWHEHLAPFLHAMEWHDPELQVTHVTVIRASDAASLWREVKLVQAMIKTHRAKATSHARPEPPAPQASVPAPSPEQGRLTQTPSCPHHGAEKVTRSKKFAGWYCKGYLGKRADGGKAYCQWVQYDQ